eukprot:647289_1
MSDSSSDDDIPIASTLNTNTRVSNSTKKRESSDDESSSDDDIPINQLRKTTISMDDSSSDDDAPLMPKKQPRRSASTSSTDSPLISKRKRKRKRHNRFNDSDESDDNDDNDSEADSGSSDDDEPIVKASQIIRRPPKKKVRRTSNNYYSSPSKSSTGSLTPQRRRKKGSASSPGHLGRECVTLTASNYARKPSIAPLRPQQGALKWWEQENDRVVSYSKADDAKNKVKWHSLDHNGIVFPPPYGAHGIPIKYDGEEVYLTPDQEEIATFYALMIETDWAQKEKFRKNFFKEFQKICRDKKQSKTFEHIVSLDKCDFKAIYDWYAGKKEAEKVKRKDKEYRERIKQDKELADSLYGYALVDGILEKVGNYKVEPPGLFRGRGAHPKMGMLKKRIMPCQVVLNIGENTPIPPCPVEGQDWGGICHDPTVTYIAKWVENVNGSHKCVYLGASSRFKGQHDRNKYEKARVLKSRIRDIRADYEGKLVSSNLMLKQLATAVWMIDKLSIRVGNEKDTDEQADTVGVCSLRKEHITLIPVEEGKEEYKITLDFLGKDSMRYHNTVTVTKLVHVNLKRFLRGKKKDQDIFEKIDPNKVNEYLRQQMEGLTAKVFRTHNASTTLQAELSKAEHDNTGKVTADSPLEDKIFFYNQCNKQVAILCNHQRTVSKSHAEQLERMDKLLQDMREQLEEAQEEYDIKVGKKKKSKKKKKKKVKKEEDSTPKKKRNRSEEQLLKFIANKEKQIRKKELAKALKEDNKEVALGTSKINYMDPRITVAWCKQMEVPIEKIFNKSLLDKFPWAMQAHIKYQF